MAFEFINKNVLVDMNKVEAVVQKHDVLTGVTSVKIIIGDNTYAVDSSIEELITKLRQPDLSKQITQV